MDNQPSMNNPNQIETLIDHVQTSIFLVNVGQDGTFRFEKVNKTLGNATGWTNDFLKGKTPVEAFGEETGTTIEANYQRCVEVGHTISYEETLDLPTGKKTGLLKLTPVSSEERIVQIVGASMDITEIKRNEEIQKQLNQRIEAGLRAGNLSWWEMELPSGKVWFNDRKAQLLGFPPEDFNHYEDFMRLVHPDDYGNAMQEMRAHINGETDIYEVEYRIKSNSGEYRWFKDVGNITERDDKSGALKVIGIVQDITEQKRLETDLRKSEEKFRNLFQKHLAVQLLIDTNTKDILDANEAAANYYGWTKAELKQMKISQINTLSPEEMKIEMEKALTDQRVYFQFKHRLANSEVRDVEVFSNHLEIDGKKVIHAIIHDITEKKRNQRELIKAKKQAEMANKAKSEFLSTMSHELRTPLNGVIGFSEILKSTSTDENHLSYLDVILSSANHLLEIISDILDLSKIEARHFELYPEKTDLRPLIEKTVSVVRHKAQQKELTLVVDIADNVPRIVEVDGGRLKQILLNLLSNAVKFTEEGGVTLNVKQLESRNKKTRLLFKVVDTGIGIREKDQERICEPFQQLDMSTTRQYGGTGLGVTITNDLLQKMDSKLELNSTYGKGSVFSFELVLPCEGMKKTPDQAKIEEHSDSTPFKNKTVLVAEDDQVNMKYARTAISMFSKGIQIIEAKNGQEAYELFLKHKPDLIFMDIIMPEIDGYLATGMIRQSDKNVPIVAMTAKALKADKEACLESGMNDYIAKPVSLERLKETLKKYL